MSPTQSKAQRTPEPREGAAGRLKVGVLHPGTQHSWQTALALQEGGMLAWYASSIFYDPDRWPYRVERYLPSSMAERATRYFRRRCDPRLDLRLVRRLGPWGWIAAGAGTLAGGMLAGWSITQGNRDFGKRVVRLLEREPVDVVWAYDTAALEVFRWAKKRGIFCVLDRTIAHGATANRVIAEEYSRNPEFFLAPFVPKPRRQLDEEQEELELADVVLVGSRFCAKTLTDNGCPGTKIQVLNYGYDERAFPGVAPERLQRKDTPLEFLFAGAAAPRKGIAYLLKAFNEISPRAARLTLIGRLAVPAATFEKYAGNVLHVPQIGRTEVARHFARAHCFIFPSRLEGSALVLREIYGAGLGAVHTRAAGEGVIDGRNGIILEEASVAGLVQAIERIETDRDCLARWQEESWALRDQRTWSVYRQGVRDLIDAMVDAGGLSRDVRAGGGPSVEVTGALAAGTGAARVIGHAAHSAGRAWGSVPLAAGRAGGDPR